MKENKISDRRQVISKLRVMANHMRQQLLKMGYSAGTMGAHFGSGLSIVDITATLYGSIMKFDTNNPHYSDRDRFILSKGHGSLGLYTALAEVGLLSVEELMTFEINDGFLPGQPQMNMDKGIEFSSGSLGHGLSFGIGSALYAKNKGKAYRTYVLMGDGECNEGSVWEAAMSASHFKLNNLIAIIDRNNLQSDGISSVIMNMDDFPNKWRCFGWETIEIDGHNIEEIFDALSHKNQNEKPYAIIANTVKGKGVSFMENNNEWHHNRLSKEQYETAMFEVTEQINMEQKR